MDHVSGADYAYADALAAQRAANTLRLQFTEFIREIKICQRCGALILAAMEERHDAFHRGVREETGNG